MRGPEIVGDRFELEHKVGEGVMGVVYRARDLNTGEPVALKIFEGLFGDEGDAKFLRDAAIVAELRHPAMVRYIAYQASIRAGRHLAMEWLEGQTLERRLKRAPLTLRQAVTLGARLAGALAALHARGVVHKGLRLRNVFLVSSPDRESAAGSPEDAKLLDLDVDRIGGREVTVLRPIAADTVRYMPPEQIKGDPLHADARADVHALGGLLFRCIAGRDPYMGEETIDVMNAIIAQADAPRLRDLRPDTPAALCDLVAWMLAKKRDARPANGAEVASALETLGYLGEGRDRSPREVPILPPAPAAEKNPIHAAPIQPPPLMPPAPVRPPAPVITPTPFMSSLPSPPRPWDDPRVAQLRKFLHDFVNLKLQYNLTGPVDYVLGYRYSWREDPKGRTACALCALVPTNRRFADIRKGGFERSAAGSRADGEDRGDVSCAGTPRAPRGASATRGRRCRTGARCSSGRRAPRKSSPTCAPRRRGAINQRR
jgi:serine/threonine protein kinase